MHSLFMYMYSKVCSFIVTSKPLTSPLQNKLFQLSFWSYKSNAIKINASLFTQILHVNYNCKTNQNQDCRGSTYVLTNTSVDWRCQQLQNYFCAASSLAGGYFPYTSDCKKKIKFLRWAKCTKIQLKIHEIM